MKPWRVLYMVVLVASLSLTFVSYYKYQLKDEELRGHQKLSHYSDEALKQINARLAQSKEELEKTLKKVEKLNKTIAALQKDNSGFKAKLQVFRKEREILQVRIARLLEEKTVLEKRFLSLEELKKAIKVAKIAQKEQKAQRRLTRIGMLNRLDEIALQQGNRGYLVKSGTSTFSSRVKIKVELEPLSNWSYREIENR